MGKKGNVMSGSIIRLLLWLALAFLIGAIIVRFILKLG